MGNECSYVGLPEDGQSRYSKHNTGIHHVYHVFREVLQLDSSEREGEGGGEEGERKGGGRRERIVKIPKYT